MAGLISSLLKWTSDYCTAHALAIGLVVLLICLYFGKIIRFLRALNNYIKVQRALRRFPHPKTHWLLGNLHDNPGTVGDAICEYMIDLVEQFPRASSYFFSSLRGILTLSHPEDIRAILKSSMPKATSNFGTYGFLRKWLGDGLLISKGSKWFRNRKLLTPAFHFDVLKPYISLKNEAVDKLVARLGRQAGEAGGSVEVYGPVSLCTLDVILKCACSYTDDVQSVGKSHPYVDAVLNIAKLLVYRVFHPYLYPELFFNMSSAGKDFNNRVAYVHTVCRDVISKRKKLLEEDPDTPRKRYMDFLDILLLARDEEGKGLTEEEIRHEVDTFMFEGHDTTASGISWALHTLAAHPEHQARAQREVDGLLNDRSPSHLTWEDMATLPYLTLCIKEALRINPPVIIISRETTESTEMMGLPLPIGTMIDINIFGLHHNPAVWGDDHREFKPERFEQENIAKMDNFAYVPFSAGPRNCIGQNFAMHELKIIIAQILHKFTMRLDPDHPAEHAMEVVMRSKDGIHLILTPRN